MTKERTMHTATPWFARQNQRTGKHYIGTAGVGWNLSDTVIAELVGDAAADAAFIVRAVNAHAGLVAALTEAEGTLAAMHKDGWKVGGDLLTRIRAALTEAKK